MQPGGGEVGSWGGGESPELLLGSQQGGCGRQERGGRSPRCHGGKERDVCHVRAAGIALPHKNTLKRGKKRGGDAFSLVEHNLKGQRRNGTC